MIRLKFAAGGLLWETSSFRLMPLLALLEPENCADGSVGMNFKYKCLPLHRNNYLCICQDSRVFYCRMSQTEQ